MGCDAESPRRPVIFNSLPGSDTNPRSSTRPLCRLPAAIIEWMIRALSPERSKYSMPETRISWKFTGTGNESPWMVLSQSVSWSDVCRTRTTMLSACRVSRSMVTGNRSTSTAIFRCPTPTRILPSSKYSPSSCKPEPRSPEIVETLSDPGIEASRRANSQLAPDSLCINQDQTANPATRSRAGIAINQATLRSFIAVETQW